MWPFKKQPEIPTFQAPRIEGVTLPPPPPGRIFQFLTPIAQDAAQRRHGALYDLLVDTVFEMNPGCFQGKGAVQLLLHKMLWPPRSLEDLFLDFPHIPHIATHLRLSPDGDWIEVFESNPQRYLQIAGIRACSKRAFVEQFGDVDRFRQIKRQCVASGEGTADQLDELLRSKMEAAEKELLQSQGNVK